MYLYCYGTTTVLSDTNADYRYSENKKSTAEANEILADAIDGVDWDQITSGAQFVFIQVNRIANTA